MVKKLYTFLNKMKKNIYIYICDVPHRIGENVSGTIYVGAPFNQVNAF